MRLAVLGSMPAAVVNAAWASATLGEEVAYVTDAAPPGAWSTEVRWEGRSRPSHVERIKVGDGVEADAFLLVASREESIELVKLYAEVMGGRPVLLAPGGFALVEAIADLLNQGASSPSALGQLPGFPANGRIENNSVHIHSVKRRFPLGALREEDSSALVGAFRAWFPDLAESTLVETTLSNTNNVIHPPLLLVNAARTERADGYLLYRQGVSAGASRLIDHIDSERLALLKALNQDAISITGWMERYYGDQGLTGETTEEMLTTLPALAGSRGPETLEHRFVTEDIICGLAPMEELAHRCGLDAPYLTSTITALSAICGVDLRSQAPTLADKLAF